MRSRPDDVVLLTEAAQRGSRPAFVALRDHLASRVREVLYGVLGSECTAVAWSLHTALARLEGALPTITPDDAEADAIEIARQVGFERRDRQREYDDAHA